jgi:hypothetical protein
MQFHFLAEQFLREMVVAVFIVEMPQPQLITLFRALVAADTIGKTSLLHVIDAITQRLINHLKN